MIMIEEAIVDSLVTVGESLGCSQRPGNKPETL
jgi:hypothetical protein